MEGPEESGDDPAGGPTDNVPDDPKPGRPGHAGKPEPGGTPHADPRPAPPDIEGYEPL